MDSKQGALYTILVLGGIGLLAVSCSDSDEENGHHAATEQHAGSIGHHEAGEERHEASAGHGMHWSYSGETGPASWGSLKDEYSLCGTGERQSPIDISTVTITDLPKIQFHYQSSPLAISNNGHTIKVSYAPGSYITVGDKRYDLLQFHFHTPSEHSVGGKHYDMVAHLVHQSVDGQLAVVGVMFDAGSTQNATIAKLWGHMPEKTGETNSEPEVKINAADLLPRDLTYFNYSGSLTTPPCSQDVNWMVLATPVTASTAQVERFSDIFPLSTRPVQPLNDRVVNASN
jgi:carbonic anhydrase